MSAILTPGNRTGSEKNKAQLSSQASCSSLDKVGYINVSYRGGPAVLKLIAGLTLVGKRSAASCWFANSAEDAALGYRHLALALRVASALGSATMAETRLQTISRQIKSKPTAFVTKFVDSASVPVCPDIQHLQGLTAVVTGGSRGIGLAIAKAIAAEGVNVAILAKTTEPHPKLPGTIFTGVTAVLLASAGCGPCCSCKRGRILRRQSHRNPVRYQK